MKHRLIIVVFVIQFLRIECYAILTTLHFYSYGINKTEDFCFINDSMCVYIQKWGSCVPQEFQICVDTFYYQQYISPDTPLTNDSMMKFVITNRVSSHLPLKEPIDERLFQSLNFKIPRSIVYEDKYLNITVGAISRRCRYDVWDIPMGHYDKKLICNNYAVKFNIQSDTLILYDKQVLRFCSTEELLYTKECLQKNSISKYSYVTNFFIAQEKMSYEYNRYLYFTGQYTIPTLNINDIIDKRFYYSSIYLNEEESLYFCDSSCCIYQSQKDSGTYSYEIKDNFIVLHKYSNDTLAYNNGFIFYAQFIDNKRGLEIKTFHERIKRKKYDRGKKLHRLSKSIINKELYLDYADFERICFDTYIPLNYSCE